MKSGQENESHLSLQLATERKTIDSTSKSLSKCETLLKRFTDKNEQFVHENSTLADQVCICRANTSTMNGWWIIVSLSLAQVVELKRNLAESQKREDVLSQEFRSLTSLLKETQHNLKISNEKINNLSVRITLSIFHMIESIFLLFQLPHYFWIVCLFLNLTSPRTYTTRYTSINLRI